VRNDRFLMVAGAVLVLGYGLGAQPKAAAEEEEEVPLSSVPEVVKAAAATAVPGIVLDEAERETEDGLVVYDLEGEAGGKEYELEITADGTVLDVEVEEDDEDEEDDDDEDKVPLAQVPQVVKDAAAKAVPGIVLEEAERETEGGQVVFNLEGEAGGKDYELEITAEGKVLEVEVEDEDED